MQAGHPPMDRLVETWHKDEEIRKLTDTNQLIRTENAHLRDKLQANGIEHDYVELQTSAPGEMAKNVNNYL